MICKKAFYVFPLEIVEIVCTPKRGGVVVPNRTWVYKEEGGQIRGKTECVIFMDSPVVYLLSMRILLQEPYIKYMRFGKWVRGGYH